MKELFSAFYRPTEEDFKKYWAKAIFVLDTNILLDFYRYSEKARKEVFNIFEDLGDRIWVPYQAALEFQRNRLTVIAKEKSRFLKIINVLSDANSTIRKEFENLGLTKSYSPINTKDFLDEIEKSINKFTTKLKKLEKEQLSILDDDPIRKEIDKLLKNRIGTPLSQEEIDQIYKLATERFKHHIPPGFRDKDKAKDKEAFFSYSAIIYQKEFGDFVIWSQIIEKAKKDKLESIIFISDDKKDDWWLIVDAEGKKTIGPRPELISEIQEKAGVKFFHMYNLDQFLGYSKKYLRAKVSDESILEVRDVEKTNVDDIRHRNYEIQQALLVEDSIYKLIQDRYPDAHIQKSGGGVLDLFIHDTKLNKRQGVIVLHISDPTRQYGKIKTAFMTAQVEIKIGLVDGMIIIFALKDWSSFDLLRDLVDNDFINFQGELDLIFGLVEYDEVDPKGFIKPKFICMYDAVK